MARAKRITPSGGTGLSGQTLVILGGILLLGILTCATVRAAAGLDEEVRVEAAFLYNFLRFVSWPNTAFTDAKAPLTIGILGDDPMVSALASIQGTVLKGRTIQVRRVTLAEAARCQLLFLSKAEKAQQAEVLRAVERRPVLTVAEIKGFVRQGGTVEFVLVGDSVRFKVNLEAARNHQLKLSSQMLGVAVEVVRN
jgi:hypothetical protein